MEMLSFQWNAPPMFPEVRAAGMWVVVLLHPEGQRTRVSLRHLGWREGPEWERAWQHFSEGWKGLLARLERRFTEGPIDWGREAMMYQRDAGSPR